MKTDWKEILKRKATSRKLWMAIVGFVTGLLVFLGKSESEAAQIGGLIMQGASVIAYIIGEGMADAANAPVYVVAGEPAGDDAEEDDGK